MTKQKLTLPRRLFLRGAAGVTLGLPILETFQPRGARAQVATTPPFLMMVIHANGVVQAGRAIDGSTDPERFWPTQTGAMTTAALETDKASLSRRPAACMRRATLSCSLRRKSPAMATRCSP
jgi:hypothetical protein